MMWLEQGGRVRMWRVFFLGLRGKCCVGRWIFKSSDVILVGGLRRGAAGSLGSSEVAPLERQPVGAAQDHLLYCRGEKL